MRFFPSLLTKELSPVGQDFRELAKIVNGELSFNDNLKGALIEATLTDAETSIYHGLGYIPLGFIVINKSGAGDIWGSRVRDWTKESLFLGSSVTNLEVRLFVL